MRIGIGYDIHKLERKRKLIIGGIHVPFSYGLAGHSDADVLAHAIMDALLGAAALKDIGNYFPINDPKYNQASSMDLLNQVNKLIEEKGYCIGNIDSTIIAEEPTIAPYIDKMRNRISRILNIDMEKIMIKATTNEGLDAVGSKKAIAAFAVSLLLDKKTVNK